jgi:hypothetical protein
MAFPPSESSANSFLLDEAGSQPVRRQRVLNEILRSEAWIAQRDWRNLLGRARYHSEPRRPPLNSMVEADNIRSAVEAGNRGEDSTAQDSHNRGGSQHYTSPHDRRYDAQPPQMTVA